MIVLVLVGAIVWLIIVLATVYDALRRVEEGSVEALLVFGEMDAVLEPGLHFVPPFVSQTHPIDTQSMLIETDSETMQLPEEFKSEVRTAIRN
jgi:regulator of protease activity HflC (stomatin/prohibitin superfamily)